MQEKKNEVKKADKVWRHRLVYTKEHGLPSENPAGLHVPSLRLLLLLHCKKWQLRISNRNIIITYIIIITYSKPITSYLFYNWLPPRREAAAATRAKAKVHEPKYIHLYLVTTEKRQLLHEPKYTAASQSTRAGLKVN